MSSLKEKTLNGLIWSSIERFSIQGLNFILGLVLARLLMPSEYGLIGMLAIFMSISQALIDSGFSQALIQKKDVSNKDYSTVFYFNTTMAFIIYAILFSIAQPVANFYNEPILVKLIRIIGISIIFNSFSIVQLAKLSKKLDFKTQSKATLSSVVLSGFLAIYLAYSGWGVWALAMQVITKSGLNALFLMYFTKWKPQFVFSKTSFKSLFPFGSRLLASGLLNAIFSNIYLIVIGRIYNKNELGFYTRANQFQQLPSETLTVILQRVTFPVLSSIQNQEEKLFFLYKKFIKFAGFIIFPLMIGLATIAKPLVITILTEKWINVVEYLQLLSFVGILYPIHAINLNILKVKGRSDLFLKLEVIKKVLILTILFFTYSYGITAMIIGQIIVSIIALFLNTYYTGKMINYGFAKQLKDLIPAFLIASSMGIIVHFSINIFDSNLTKLLFGIIAGALSYYTLAMIFKFSEIKIINSIIYEKF